MEQLAFVKSLFNITKQSPFLCSKLTNRSSFSHIQNTTTTRQKNSNSQVLVASQSFEKMKDCMIELFRQSNATKQSSQLPHLFVGQLRPLKTDSRINLSILGIFASCVIIFSSILKKALSKDPFKPKSLADSSSSTVVQNEREQQYFGELEYTFHALDKLKSAINDDAEHASDLFLKLVQEASAQRLANGRQPVTNQSLERIVTDILKEVDKKLRYYHSLFVILEKFSQQAVNELETHLKEASNDDNLVREIMQDFANVSYAEMKTMPHSVSELYEQLRKNNTATPISQKCEKVSLDITRMKRTLQFTLSKLQALRAASSNVNIIDGENQKQVNGALTEMEPREWLQFLETKTDISKLSSLQCEIENMPMQQQWCYLSSILERSYQTGSNDNFSTDSNSAKQLLQKKDEEIAFLRQRLHEMEQIKMKTRKVRTRASKSDSNSEQTVAPTKATNKRNRNQKKVVTADSEDNTSM